jgi:hypothetical protein
LLPQCYHGASDGPGLGREARAPKKKAGAVAPAIAPPGLEPKATCWGQPGLS